PVPGETALLAGAAMARFGLLALPRVIGFAIAGAILGDNLGFIIGRHGGRILAQRHGWRVGLTARRLQQFDRFFDRHAPKTVFFARFVTGLRVVGAVLAGGSRLRWRTFLLYNALGAVAWSVAIGLAGYGLAYSWETLERWIGRSGVIALAVVALVAVIPLVRPPRSREARDA